MKLGGQSKKENNGILKPRRTAWEYRGEKGERNWGGGPRKIQNSHRIKRGFAGKIGRAETERLTLVGERRAWKGDRETTRDSTCHVTLDRWGGKRREVDATAVPKSQNGR